MKNSGRTVLVFLGLTIVILLCAIAISLYLLQKETTVRQNAEVTIEELSLKTTKIETALTEAQKQIGLLEGKNKDADDKINGLQDDVAMEKGLKEELKKENLKLADSLESEVKAKVELRNKLSKDLDDVQSKLKAFESAAVAHKQDVQSLQKQIIDFKKKNDGLEQKIKDLNAGTAAQTKRSEILPVPGVTSEEKVELDRIVVTPDPGKQGKVLNVDTDAEFLIFDLGARNGMQQGMVMSVNRGKTYLGDVRVTRVQDEMSAADFVPPFSSRKVRKNDQVVTKK